MAFFVVKHIVQIFEQRYSFGLLRCRIDLVKIRKHCKEEYLIREESDQDASTDLKNFVESANIACQVKNRENTSGVFFVISIRPEDELKERLSRGLKGQLFVDPIDIHELLLDRIRDLKEVVLQLCGVLPDEGVDRLLEPWQELEVEPTNRQLIQVLTGRAKPT